MQHQTIKLIQQCIPYSLIQHVKTATNIISSQDNGLSPMQTMLDSCQLNGMSRTPHTHTNHFL